MKPRKPRVYLMRYKVFAREPGRLRLIRAEVRRHTAIEVLETQNAANREFANTPVYLNVVLLDRQQRAFMREMAELAGGG